MRYKPLRDYVTFVARTNDYLSDNCHFKFLSLMLLVMGHHCKKQLFEHRYFRRTD